MEQDHILTHRALKVSCKLSQPDHGPIQRIVLGVHGITGSAQDQIQTDIAEEMSMFHLSLIHISEPTRPY